MGMNAVMKVEDGERLTQPIAGVLTDKQRLFAQFFVELGGHVMKAAELAGYADTRFGYQLQRLPHVQAAIRAEQTRQLEAGAARGVGFMVKALDDPKMPGAVRFQCARWLAEAGGYGLAAQRAQLGLPGEEKPLSEMTVAELDAFIAAGRAAAAKLVQDRARTIEGEVVRNDARSEDAQPAE